MEEFDHCYAISPLDGRYSKDTEELQLIASEFGLMKSRVIVMITYLIALTSELVKNKFERVRPLTNEEISELENIYKNFSKKDFDSIKEFEKVTDHDVKAVEYFLRDRLAKLGFQEFRWLVHFGKTSEDVNNCAYAFVLSALVAVVKKYYQDVALAIGELAKEGENIPMLAQTHGQPATPTTFGWTDFVPYERLTEYLSNLDTFYISVKFGGATGADNALNVAFSNINWREFNSRLIGSLGKIQLVELEGIKTFPSLEINHHTFQIEPHDTYKELFDKITSLNLILVDYCLNKWLYISRGIYGQIPKKGEVGSSAMPQKINPIKFENAESNLKLANALFGFLSATLPVSRGYRDLTDSTLERNFGSAFAYTLISLKSILKGMAKIKINKEFAERELNEHWEIISEAYQVILKRAGVDEGYEIIAEEIKGKHVTEAMLHELIGKLKVTHNLSDEIVFELKAITPENYLGNRSFEL